MTGSGQSSLSNFQRAKSACANAVTAMPIRQQIIHAGKYDPAILTEGEKEHPLSPARAIEIAAGAMYLKDCLFSLRSILRCELKDDFLSDAGSEGRRF
jgi:hypothetical protein